MSFRINTNISSLNANNNATSTNKKLSNSLERLSSGLRINKAADDASGMSIANSLRFQASALKQSIANGNDAIGILQTADYAMSEQIEIMNTIRVKAIQAANDYHTRDSRLAIQQDLIRLLEEFDNIANTTSFNTQKLLNGNFSNKNFQMGAGANETISISIPSSKSVNLGHLSFNTSSALLYDNTSADFAQAQWNFSLNYGTTEDEKTEFTFSGQDLLKSGLKFITDKVNATQAQTGIRATAKSNLASSVRILGSKYFGPVDLSINGISILRNANINRDDSDHVLADSINMQSHLTGVSASVDSTSGLLRLDSSNGLPIHISTNKSGSEGALGMFFSKDGTTNNILNDVLLLGELSFIKQGGASVSYSITAANQAAKNQKGVVAAGLSNAANTTFTDMTNQYHDTTNLHDFLTKPISGDIARAMGDGVVGAQSSTQAKEPGVITYAGSQILIDIALKALSDLDRIRSNLGSAQNQIISTINNMQVTQINIKSAQSQISDVDFASEIANFNKQNILAQSGNYASAQANQIKQNILRLLQ